jgi:hypothetical protein
MRKTIGALLLLVATAAAAADFVPRPGEFAAHATVNTKQGTRSMGFDVVVTNPMTVEQAQPLKRTLEEGGQQALLNAIRGGSRGRIRLGGYEYPVDLVVAEPTKDGERYFVVTARTLKYEEIQEGRDTLNHPFTVIVFDVPGFGKGDGRIYTQAALSVDADGHVKADQYEGRVGTLKDVKRLK